MEQGSRVHLNFMDENTGFKLVAKLEFGAELCSLSPWLKCPGLFSLLDPTLRRK